jgi:polysaccharide export outer membrane protein
LKTQLTAKAREKVLDPVVYVKFNSFKVTMLGEVTTKGVLTVPTDKITIMEAFGLSGDVTQYGVKTNVKIIREDSSGRTMGTVDLTNKNLFSSEYFYLRPNDIVYVPSDGNQKRQQNFNNIYPYVSLGLSAFSFLLTIFYLFRN